MRPRRALAGVLLSALLLAPLSALGAPEPSPSPAPEAAPYAQALLGVVLNGNEVSAGELLYQDANGIYVSEETLVRCNLTIAQPASFERDGSKYYALKSFAGVTYSIVPSTGQLSIRAAISAFTPSYVKAVEAAREPRTAEAGTGTFVNYELLGQHLGTGLGTTLRGLFDVGRSFKEGTFETHLLSAGFPTGKVLRLDTTYAQDDLAKRTTFKAGDAVSVQTTTANPTRFAGLQWATNFATDPSFITYPLPTLYGTTANPSSIQVLVNGLPRAMQNVPSGAFSIANVPLYPGADHVQLLITDASGNQRVIDARLYESPMLLKRGLSSHAIEIGFPRDSTNVLGERYEAGFASATYRRGVNDHLTAGAHAELLIGNRRSISGEALYSLGNAGVVTLGFGKSGGPRADGTKVVYGYDYSNQRFGFGFTAEHDSAQWTDISRSFADPKTHARTRIAGRATVRLGNRSSLSASTLYSDTASYFDGNGIPVLSTYANIPTHLTSFSYVRSFGHNRFLAQYYTTTALGIRTWGASTQLLVMLGSGLRKAEDSLQTDAQVQNNTSTETATFTHVATELGHVSYAGGIGLSSTGKDVLASATDRLPFADVYATVDDGNTNGFRWDARIDGSVVFGAHHAFASEPITTSYGIVSMPGSPHARIYRNGALVGRLDDRGTLLVPDLFPYRYNEITVDQRDLPIDAHVDGKTKFIPLNRGGALIRLRTHIERSALVSLVNERGVPLAAGTMLSDARDGKAQWPVADGGQAFLTPIKEGPLDIVADSDGEKCRVHIDVPSEIDNGADLGQVVCRR